MDPALRDDWHPVLRADALGEGTRVAAQILGEEFVVWRSGDRVKAWQDLCAHRRARLSLGRVCSETLLCPHRGWRYGEDGRCVHIPSRADRGPPAKARVQSYRLREAHGMVWVSLGAPALEPAALPEAGNARFRSVLSGPSGPVPAAAPRLIENFLDVAHFPFVHEGSLGDPARPEIGDYQARCDADGVAADDIAVYPPDPCGKGAGDEVRYDYRVFRPLTAYLRKRTRDGRQLSILFPVTPHAERMSSAWVLMAVEADDPMRDEAIHRFHGDIPGEDLPMVTPQRPELLPLDLQAELHLRSDRTAIAYRRWLRDLGLRYGTS